MILPGRRLKAAVGLRVHQAVPDAVQDAVDTRQGAVREAVQLRLRRAEDPAIAAHPQIAATVVQNRRDHVVRQPFRPGNRRKFSAPQAIQPAAVGPDPKRAVNVLVNRSNEFTRKTISCGVRPNAAIRSQSAQSSQRPHP